MPWHAIGQLVAPTEIKKTIEDALADVRRNRIIERIWQKDHSVWKPDSTEISNRLGWLEVADDMRGKVEELTAFAEEICTARFRHVVVLGMGGSSLCPEVLRATFGRQPGFYPRLHVLDSTVPAWVRRVSRTIDLEHTLFIVSSKSGGTIEVMSFFKYFWLRVEKKKGGKAGENFIAITDPGASLNALATQHGFRKVFLNPPDIGGRYSALSYFGLVPAALMGLDLAALLDPALEMMAQCRTDASVNPAAWLGAAMGALARMGRNKVTLITSPSIASFGLWVEQLIAESTGKNGRGIVPIAHEPLVTPSNYSGDRLFINLHVEDGGEGAPPGYLDALTSAGLPLLTLRLRNRYDLGAEFFRWELATAVAGHILGIHPFDQPNVQESKDNTRRMLDRFKSEGALPTSTGPAHTPASAPLDAFLTQAQPGDYVALMAYLDETPDVARALHDLRAAILERHRLPNTLGYGPRFLHSTGQLHKGGANNGLFVQLTASAGRDVPISGELFSFGVLAAAQAGGDLAALRAHGRRAMHIDLGANPARSLQRLVRSLGGSPPKLKRTGKRQAARKTSAQRRSTTRTKSNSKRRTRRA